MKICYLSDARSVHTAKWVSWFHRAGHEVCVFSVESGTEDWDPEIPVHRLKTTSIFNSYRLWHDLQKIKRYIKEAKPDIIHAHFVSINGFIGALLGFHPLVVTAWGSDILVNQHGNKLWRVKYALKKANCLTCDAQHAVERMVELGASRGNISRINFGIDAKLFCPRGKDIELAQELGLTNRGPVIVSSRQLHPIYDVESLIQAIPGVLKKFEDAVFLILGDGPERGALEELAASLGVSGSVVFTGRLPNQLFPKYLCLADVYVSTSLSDAGIAASTAEAMACGLPVVSTDFGENDQWIVDGEGGYLVPIKSPTELTNKLIRLLSDRKILESAGTKNRAIVVENNDYESEMGKMESIYAKLIKS